MAHNKGEMMITQEVPNDHRLIDATTVNVDLKGRACLGVRAQAAGNIQLEMGSGVSVVYPVAVGDYVFGQFARALSAGTTALFVEVYRSASFPK